MRWSFYATWTAGLIPLCTLILLWTRGERRNRSAWLLAVGFAVSWLSDGVGLLLYGAMPGIGWSLGRLYPVPQGALIAAALTRRRWQVSLLLIAAAVAAVCSLWLEPELRRPSLLTWSVVSLGLLALLAMRRPWGLAQWAILVYFGLGGITGRIWLPGFVGNPPVFFDRWTDYQFCRTMGLGLIAWAVSRDPQLQEVPHERG